ncbi:DNA-dependent protein kinase catalytic subunit [Monoraphidium neglectum]|uniref:DNA-dependent protein kinase catalytic subunit n=1 Tax=Monoraphidium neglectum TaxID=145388 RepID=A0A0D2N6I6_9CHLO|nr:DNA-dependent protein kinase catalytic subunit [Monoraphidium neglectum]KIZ07907.1 DNA-dependent protein kinase catalytic subunit [Monoraphidium neglectum]|eukprot:XP_013906926.1 DNA-dependent protein kinase catalytic subunit [Monoraphidium neglectum]
MGFMFFWCLVQQLFRLIGGLAGRSAECVSRGLAGGGGGGPGGAGGGGALVTYDVIPMSPRLGLLEFVEGTTPLEAAINAGLSAKDAPKKALESARDDFAAKIASFARRHAKEAAAAAAAAKKTQGSAKGAAAQLPPDNPHVTAFAAPRAEALPVPELVPFRLTRQLQGLFLPHAPCDALHPLLAALLESMRQEAQVLSSALAVFTAEPLLDWVKEAQSIAALRAAVEGGARGGGGGGGREREERLLQMKIEHAGRRLACEGPVSIILEGASLRQGHSPQWGNIEAAVKGRRGVDARADLPASGPLPGGASSCAAVLLELAADEGLLARTYAGWQPYA